MRSLEKNRPRLLVVCKNSRIRNELVLLLTSYGYYVDYEETRSQGIAKFRQHKHMIVIFDAEILPKFPRRMFRVFTYFQRHPMILIAAEKKDESKVFQYLQLGAYDIIDVPLNMDYLSIVFRRMVSYNQLESKHEFIKLLVALTILSLPLWGVFAYIFSRF